MKTFQVAHERCNQCLFTRQKIVSNKRRKQIIQEALRKDTFFVCHKATIIGHHICCRSFYDIYRNDVLITRLAQLFNIVEFIDIEQLQEDPCLTLPKPKNR